MVAYMMAFLIARFLGASAAVAVGAATRWRVPDYRAPNSMVVLDALPLTPHGKLDVAAMRALRVQSTAASATAFEAPEGEHEQILAGVWAEVIGVDRVGRHDRFISLGGDSIKSIQILARLRARGLTLDLKDLFRFPTVAELAPRPQARKASATQTAGGAVALTRTPTRGLGFLGSPVSVALRVEWLTVTVMVPLSSW